MEVTTATGVAPSTPRAAFEPDWLEVARLVLTSREIDRVEEAELVPAGLVTYQFSARGHELPQVLLGLAMSHPRDAAAVYYRSRPFALACGLTAEEALAASMGRAGSPSAGRDIGVVHSLPPRGRATVLPASGDVGAQYSVGTGWAAAIRYRVEVMGDADWRGAMAATLGGDGSTATPGFWGAVNAAATGCLPLLLLVEDNAFAISVRSEFQTPGRNIASNLASFADLALFDVDGTDPAAVASAIGEGAWRARAGEGPTLVRVTVPRLCGHSFADNQAYKTDAERSAELARDPLPHLRDFLSARGALDESGWERLASDVAAEVAGATARARSQPTAAPSTALGLVFHEPGSRPAVGGTRPEGAGLALSPDPAPAVTEPVRLNLIDAVRRVLEREMAASPRVVVFGEDVGAKGGVHGATRDLQSRFGPQRVFDTALHEDAIIGRAAGMALAGLVPVPEIQFRKYADPATEQLNDTGTVRWRTAGRFAAPVVVRIPVGVSRATGDPWHSVCGESVFAHAYGWRVAIPSNAEDAVGLLRSALRGDDPTYFLEHRALYDSSAARRPYPGDDYWLPFGRAAVAREGSELTLVTWGYMVHLSLEATSDLGGRVEVLDLRTIVPWDRDAVLSSVRKTGRCLIVHEDNLTAGFGAEIAAWVAQEAFTWLDAPVRRLAAPDCPVPYDPGLAETVVPTAAAIRSRVDGVLAF